MKLAEEKRRARRAVATEMKFKDRDRIVGDSMEDGRLARGQGGLDSGSLGLSLCFSHRSRVEPVESTCAQEQ